MIRRAIVFSYDLLVAPCAWIAAYWVRFNLESIPDWAQSQALSTVAFAVMIQAMILIARKSYRKIWRFTSLNELIDVCKNAIFSTLLLIAATYLLGTLREIPRSIFPLYLILLTSGMCLGRLGRRYVKEKKLLRSQDNNHNKKNAIIIGAGNAGELLARDFIKNPSNQYNLVGFLDDTKAKVGREIHGISILGQVSDVNEVVKKHDVEQIIIAIPSASTQQLKQILTQCKISGTNVSKLPSLSDLASQDINQAILKPVSLEELLGREVFNLNWNLIGESINNKSILITGAGGSIGSEVCRQILKLNPAKVIAVDSCEYNLFNLERNLSSDTKSNIFLHLSDVKDADSINYIFNQHKPDIVFHAAAYKHVPLLQSQVREAMYNNVIGTFNVAKAADKFSVDKFVLVSTDKAVSPSNIMGKTKRFGEIICQSLNTISKTKYITVRFGNVLGSAGSVIPTFKEQIEQGGPVTVTHPDTTRFFMTIPEASQLILQSFSQGVGGELFVLDMGQPIKISYLAEQMISLSGKSLDEISIIFTGLRPGEKLTEELFYSYEELGKTQHEQIHVAKVNDKSSLISNVEKLYKSINQMKSSCEAYDCDSLLDILDKTVCQSTQEETTN